MKACNSVFPRVLTAAIAAVVLLAGCSDSGDIRTQLEKVHAKFRKAIQDEDYQGFLACLDSKRLEQMDNINEAKFKEALAEASAKTIMLDMMAPDLGKTRFIKIKTLGEYAAYYAETDLDDEKWMTISVFLFRKVDGTWRTSCKSYGRTKGRPGVDESGFTATWKDEQDVLDTIENDPNFQIETLIADSDDHTDE